MLERSEAPDWMGLHLFMFISGKQVERSTVQEHSFRAGDIPVIQEDYNHEHHCITSNNNTRI